MVNMKHEVARLLGIVCIASVVIASVAWMVGLRIPVAPDLQTESVKVHGVSGTGAGELVRNVDGDPSLVLTSIHALGIPLSFEIEMPDGTKRRAFLMTERIILKVGTPQGIVE